MRNYFGYDITAEDVDGHQTPHPIAATPDLPLAAALAEGSLQYFNASKEYITRRRHQPDYHPDDTGILYIHAANHLMNISMALEEHTDAALSVYQYSERLNERATPPAMLTPEHTLDPSILLRGLDVHAGCAHASHAIQRASDANTQHTESRAHAQSAMLALQPIVDALWPPPHEDRPEFPIPPHPELHQLVQETRDLANANWGILTTRTPSIFSPSVLASSKLADIARQALHYLRDPGTFMTIHTTPKPQTEADIVVAYIYQAHIYVRTLAERPHHKFDHRSAYRLAIQLAILIQFRNESPDFAPVLEQAVAAELALAALNMTEADQEKFQQLARTVQETTGSPDAHRRLLNLIHQRDPNAAPYVEQAITPPPPAIPQNIANQILVLADQHGASQYVVDQLASNLGYPRNPEPHNEAEEYVPIMNAVGILRAIRDHSDEDIIKLADIMGYRHPSDIENILSWSYQHRLSH